MDGRDDDAQMSAHWKGSWQNSLQHDVADYNKLINARFFNRELGTYSVL
jgi:hypothetical protein